MARLAADFFARPAAQVAADLVGATLIVNGVGGTLVEVEWYDQADPASHSFRGPTPRCATMFGPPGRLYVYRSYGVHWCANVVCEPQGQGAAVLLRALEPTVGIDIMRARRGPVPDRRLCAGPGNLTTALGIDAGLDGAVVGGEAVHLQLAAPTGAVVAGPRIGLTVAKEWPRRLGVAGSRYLSRPFPKEDPQ